VSQRGSLLHDAWLSHVGHDRPGVKAGLPLDEAQTKAAHLEQQIEAAVQTARQPVSSQRKVADGELFQVHFPATLQPEQLKIYVDYYLWVPPGDKPLRGVIVHQHGCGTG